MKFLTKFTFILLILTVFVISNTVSRKSKSRRNKSRSLAKSKKSRTNSHKSKLLAKKRNTKRSKSHSNKSKSLSKAKRSKKSKSKYQKSKSLKKVSRAKRSHKISSFKSHKKSRRVTKKHKSHRRRGDTFPDITTNGKCDQTKLNEALKAFTKEDKEAKESPQAVLCCPNDKQFSEIEENSKKKEVIEDSNKNLELIKEYVNLPTDYATSKNVLLFYLVLSDFRFGKEKLELCANVQ